MSELLVLKTKKELDIFMNPTRQEILRELRRAGEPVTPKYLSDRLKISPSSIQFHIKKLEELGVVVLDHTEMIRGITAKFYKLTDVDISIFGSEKDHLEEREVVMDNYFKNVYDGYKQMLHKHSGTAMENLKKYGTDMTGTMFLSEEDAKEMFNMIQDFTKKHAKKKPGTSAWEFGIITYKMED